MTVTELVRLDGVSRVYGPPFVRALDGIDLAFARHEFVAIVGPSGSGKSTLLNMLGTLDLPTSGRVAINGIDVQSLSDDELSALRAHLIGFVFQQFHLNEGVTAVDNVADGLLYTGVRWRERRTRARKALERVGLGHRTNHRPRQMSGGERQRVAIARALVSDPPLLLADEPTGNLDSESGEGIIQLLHDLHRTGTTIIVITHDPDLAARLPRTVTIKDGTIVSDRSRTTERRP